jgi:very-short-patch-repair endonuclease
LTDAGWTVIRFREHEIKRRPGILVRRLQQRINA